MSVPYSLDAGIHQHDDVRWAVILAEARIQEARVHFLLDASLPFLALLVSRGQPLPIP